MIRPRPAPARLLDALAAITRQAERPANVGLDRAVVKLAARRLIGQVPS